jgi:CelD/BcsL family acetyltransferase involved in cellulose biosynthesis
MASPVITPVERPPATGPQAARPTPPRIEALEEPAALEALEEPWRRLFDGCLDATPFQSPDWLLPWTRRFLSGRLYCLAAWRKSALVGLAPMAIEPRPEGRTLTPLGGSITDYQGALIAPDAAGDGVVSALVAELVRAGARWDQCDFDHLRGGDPFCTFPFPAAYAEELAARSPCPYVRLPARPGDLLRALPGRLGPRLERCLRGLSRQGEVELVRASDRTIEKL